MAKPKKQLDPVSPALRTAMEAAANVADDPVTETVATPEAPPAEAGETATAEELPELEAADEIADLEADSAAELGEELAAEEKEPHDPMAVRAIAAFFYVPETEVLGWLDAGCPLGPMNAVAAWRKVNLPLPATRILTVDVPVIATLIDADYQSQKRGALDVSLDNRQHIALRFLLGGLEGVEMVGPANPKMPKKRASRSATQGDAIRWLLDQIYIQHVIPLLDKSA